MSYPLITRCFSCGSCKPLALFSQYMDLKQLESKEEDFTTRGAVPIDDSPSLKFLEDAGITRQCCRRIIFAAINIQIDITQDPIEFNKSGNKTLNKNVENVESVDEEVDIAKDVESSDEEEEEEPIIENVEEEVEVEEEEPIIENVEEEVEEE